MIHQGILDQRTTSETIRHNTLQLWLMTERERRSFHTTLWNSAGRDSEKRHNPTQYLGTLADLPQVVFLSEEVECPNGLWESLELWQSERELNDLTQHTFFESTWFDGFCESPRKLVVCHDLFPLSFSRIRVDRLFPWGTKFAPKVLHPHASYMYLVTKWNLQ